MLGGRCVCEVGCAEGVVESLVYFYDGGTVLDNVFLTSVHISL